MEEDGMQKGKRFEKVVFKRKNLKRQRLQHILDKGEEEGLMDGHDFSTMAVKIKNRM